MRICQPEIDSLREGRCSGCDSLFYICSHCDCGQTYCSDGCRKQRQTLLRRAANLRYQRSKLGRRNHADNQRDHRQRKKVTDEGSPEAATMSKVCPPGQLNTVVTVTASDLPGGRVPDDDPTLSCDPAPQGPNTATFELGRARDPARTIAIPRAHSSSGRAHPARRTFPLGQAADRCCFVCGRPGRFIRVGPLRRARLRP